MSPLADLTLREAAARVRAGEVTAVDLVRAVLARVDERDAALGAVLTRADEAALADAGLKTMSWRWLI
jgi:Asp-tRNA(Asn)/Glu-tRNA(Gln) amidotransferase A subunit family amidase